MSDEINRKKFLVDLVDKLKNEKTSNNLEYKVTAGRAIPTPSNALKPKIVVKPKDEK
ncbi:hypothetical protein [uncultured Flavobacterium sp.]|uniref:hypothetical protein n=1 Tax=uncultured Flavobacterium sp. TaxID=165435 RepID=UPI0025D240C4|nr:hypothetical protein [uncultured Flavobacterium sp.]